MDLAGRVFDVVTSASADSVNALVPSGHLEYWRRVIRLAGLLHDVGHLPFSHGAEELLPEGHSHETMTVRLILDLGETFGALTPPVRAEDVAKVAVGPKVLRVLSNQVFTPWQEILSEIIAGDALGVDRMDYLLRDSHHLGVAYGHFDLGRLISEIRLLPRPYESEELALGLEEGGSHAAEGLQLARYFMYTQVYFHPVRRSYDMLLKEFLREWTGGTLPVEVKSFLALTDNEVLAAIRQATLDEEKPGHEAARRFSQRRHYRRLYTWNASDARLRPDIVKVIYEEAVKEFGPHQVRLDHRPTKDTNMDFPIRLADERVTSVTGVSDVFSRVLPAKFECVFVTPECVMSARKWLKKELKELQLMGGVNDGTLGAERSAAGSDYPA